MKSIVLTHDPFHFKNTPLLKKNQKKYPKNDYDLIKKSLLFEIVALRSNLILYIRALYERKEAIKCC